MTTINTKQKIANRLEEGELETAKQTLLKIERLIRDFELPVSTELWDNLYAGQEALDEFDRLMRYG